MPYKVAKKKRPNVPQPVEPIDDKKEMHEELEENEPTNTKGMSRRGKSQEPTPAPPPKFEDHHVRKMIYLTHENQKRLEQEKEATRQSVSRLVNEALEEYFS